MSVLIDLAIELDCTSLLSPLLMILSICLETIDFYIVLFLCRDLALETSKAFSRRLKKSRMIAETYNEVILREQNYIASV